MFQPYHHFRECIRFRREFQRLVGTNSIRNEIQQLHNTYHYALSHKLKSAKNHLDNLEQLLTATQPQDIISATTSNEFHFNANLYIDGFFYSTGSALDILAREILSYYAIPFPRRVYFGTALDQLTTHRPGDSLIQRLQDPNWKEEFSDYRNALTHELLVVGRYSLEVHMDGGIQRQKIIVPLPDDPRITLADRSYRRNPNVMKYCADTFRRVASLINQVYTELTNRMVTRNQLPL